MSIEDRADADSRCPWCQSERLRVQKKMPSARGPGIFAYLFFPVALTMWLTNTTFNVCLDCGGRWQRGVRVDPRSTAGPLTERAGMYAEHVPTAAVVRRKQRLGPEAPVSEGDIVLTALDGSCRVCRQAAGRYDVKDAPTLPITGCRCIGGCTCAIEPAID